MPEREVPMTKTMNVAAARQQFNQLLNLVYRGDTRIIVQRSGIPVAAIISPQELRRFQQYEAERAQRFKVLDEIGAALKDVPEEELEREVSKALAEVRAERQAELTKQEAAPGRSS